MDLYEVPTDSIPHLYNNALDGQNDVTTPLQRQQTYETPVDSTSCLNSNQAQQEIDVNFPLTTKNKSAASERICVIILAAVVIILVVCVVSMGAVMCWVIFPKIEQIGKSHLLTTHDAVPKSGTLYLVCFDLASTGYLLCS